MKHTVHLPSRETLSLMTKKEVHQALFDYVVYKLHEQGKFASDHWGSPRYKAHDGSRCAIGHLLPRGVDTEAFEGTSILDAYPKADPYAVDKKALNKALVRRIGTNASYRFLVALQTAHDDTYFEDLWDVMKDVARNYHLSTVAPWDRG